MYSRNKQRKEQQLLNLRQLTAKTANISHNSGGNDQQSSNRSPPQSMANRSPNQSNSLSPNQSSKLLSRSQCRTPKRDNSSTIDCQQQQQQQSSSPSTKSETTNSMLRSVNRSPTVRSQTLRPETRSGLQSRPTNSPISRRETSLPQNLSQSSSNSQNKQLSHLRPNETTNAVKQRTGKSVNETQPQQKSLSSTSTSTATNASIESTISPEILFLVQQQAKAIAQIQALQKKVELLEHTINGQKKTNTFIDNPILEVSSSATNSSNKKSVNNSKERIHISDDSGGEYSRATTTSDDDELSLLLDQIARRSQQLQSTQQLTNRMTNISFSSSISGNNNNNNNSELMTQTMQFRSKRHPYVSNPSAPNPQISHTNQSLIREPTIDHKVYPNFNNYSNISTLITPSTVQPSAPALSQPGSQTGYNQSISALLFEPNVDNVLKNLDEIIATEAIDSNKFSNCSTISQTYQRSQSHSSQSLYDNIGLNAVGMSSGSLHTNNNNNNNNKTSSSGPNWQLERAKTLVKQREEREFDKQMRLNEEWLQTQLKADPKLFKRTNFVDSLDQTFR